MASVLFVCTANICRSPMAMALFRSQVSPQEDWRIESAGTWAREGLPASENSRLAMKERGIDLGAHFSRQVTHQLLSGFNLILTMEQNHKEALRSEFPDLASRVYRLSEMVDECRDIRDPYGSSLPRYRETAAEIEQILEQGFEKIASLARRPVEGNLPYQEG